MKPGIPAALVAAFLTIAAPTWAIDPAHAHGASHESAYAGLQLDNGSKWATDEALRRNMGKLRHTVAKHGEGGVKESRHLADSIERSVASIVSECKLEPKADANLHIIVAELLRAVEPLRSGERTQMADGAATARLALDMYAAHFDHPGWKKDKDSVRKPA